MTVILLTYKALKLFTFCVVSLQPFHRLLLFDLLHFLIYFNPAHMSEMTQSLMEYKVTSRSVTPLSYFPQLVDGS